MVVGGHIPGVSREHPAGQERADAGAEMREISDSLDRVWSARFMLPQLLIFKKQKKKNKQTNKQTNEMSQIFIECITYYTSSRAVSLYLQYKDEIKWNCQP